MIIFDFDLTLVSKQWNPVAIDQNDGVDQNAG